MPAKQRKNRPSNPGVVKERQVRRTNPDRVASAIMAVLADIVPHLARAIAPICEVVLFGMETWPPKIHAIGNGHITGRSVGDFMTRIFIDGSDIADIQDPLFNYMSRTPDGRHLRVSVIPLRHDGEVIGYISANFMVQDLMAAQQAVSFMIRTEHHAERIREEFLPTHDIIDSTIEDRLNALGRPANSLTSEQRQELLMTLRDRGVFAMRGAINRISRKLGVSRTTLYNDLNRRAGKE